MEEQHATAAADGRRHGSSRFIRVRRLARTPLLGRLERPAGRTGRVIGTTRDSLEGDAVGFSFGGRPPQVGERRRVRIPAAEQR